MCQRLTDTTCFQQINSNQYLTNNYSDLPLYRRTTLQSTSSMSAALKAGPPRSKGKEKAHPRSCARSPGSDPESLLDFQANLQALQHAQIKTALDTKQDHKQAI